MIRQSPAIITKPSDSLITKASKSKLSERATLDTSLILGVCLLFLQAIKLESVEKNPRAICFSNSSVTIKETEFFNSTSIGA